jgi:hypothetical protein
MANGPRKELSFLDRALMNKAATQGGVLNFLGQQPQVTAPIKAQSHADSPPVQLAYITDAEKDLLVKSNIHGSLAGKPNPGPAGIPSLDDFFTTPGGGIGGGSTADSKPDTKDDQGNFNVGLGGGSSSGGGQSAEDFGINPGMAVGGSDGTVFVSPQSAGPGEDQVNKFVEVLPEKQNQLEALAEARRLQQLKNMGIIPDKTNIFTDPKTGQFGVDTFIKNILGGNFELPGFAGGFLKLLKGVKPTVESFNDPQFLARMRTQFENEEDFNNYVDDYKDLMEEAYAGQIDDGDVGEEFKDRMESAFGAAQKGDLGTDAFRETNPTKFYEDFTPQTSGDLVNLARLDANKFPKDFANKIFAARMELDRMGKNPMTGESQGQPQGIPSLPGFKLPDAEAGLPTPPNVYPLPPGIIPPFGRPPFGPPEGDKFERPRPYNYYAQSPQYKFRGVPSLNSDEFNEQLRKLYGMA